MDLGPSAHRGDWAQSHFWVNIGHFRCMVPFGVPGGPGRQLLGPKPAIFNTNSTFEPEPAGRPTFLGQYRPFSQQNPLCNPKGAGAAFLDQYESLLTHISSWNPMGPKDPAISAIFR